MSAGNHAQAVAYHAARLKIPATIVMPVTTPFVKVGGNARAWRHHRPARGNRLSNAQARVEELVADHEMIQVHPYDDPCIVAGQGTVALEILEEVPVSMCW